MNTTDWEELPLTVTRDVAVVTAVSRDRYQEQLTRKELVSCRKCGCGNQLRLLDVYIGLTYCCLVFPGIVGSLCSECNQVTLPAEVFTDLVRSLTEHQANSGVRVEGFQIRGEPSLHTSTKGEDHAPA